MLGMEGELKYSDDMVPLLPFCGENATGLTRLSADPLTLPLSLSLSGLLNLGPCAYWTNQLRFTI